MGNALAIFNGWSFPVPIRLSAAFSLSAAIAGSSQAEPELPASLRIAAGAAVFEAHCRRCHRIDAELPAYGPSLSGIVGRPARYLAPPPGAGTLADAIVPWTRDSLHGLLGSRRARPGLPGPDADHRRLDAERVDALLDFLETTAPDRPPHDA